MPEKIEKIMIFVHGLIAFYVSILNIADILRMRKTIGNIIILIISHVVLVYGLIAMIGVFLI